MIIKFKDIPITDRPRERLKKYGCENLSNEELLAIILKVGTKDLSVLDVSRSILANYGDVKNLNYATLNKLKSLKGVGEVKATVILASIELGRRIYQTSTSLKKYNINNPRDIVSYYKEVFKDKKQEEFHIIYLDVKKNIITIKIIYLRGYLLVFFFLILLTYSYYITKCFILKVYFIFLPLLLF